MELYKMSLLQIFFAGGPVMWPILLCSIFALTIILDRFFHLHKIKIDTQEFLNSILEKMKRHETKEALKVCDDTKSPIANILKAGILKYDRSRAQIKEAIEDASLYEVPRLEKNLPALATIAHISPLLGLWAQLPAWSGVFRLSRLRRLLFIPYRRETLPEESGRRYLPRLPGWSWRFRLL